MRGGSPTGGVVALLDPKEALESSLLALGSPQLSRDSSFSFGRGRPKILGGQAEASVPETSVPVLLEHVEAAAEVDLAGTSVHDAHEVTCMSIAVYLLGNLVVHSNVFGVTSTRTNPLQSVALLMLRNVIFRRPGRIACGGSVSMRLVPFQTSWTLPHNASHIRKARTLPGVHNTMT